MHNEKITDFLRKHIDDDGNLMLDRVATIILLTWIDNAEKHLAESEKLTENIKKLMGEIK